MKSIKYFLLFSFAFSLLAGGCSKAPEKKEPKMPPGQVVTKFFDLLAENGKLTNREAFTMLSGARQEISQDSFRRWTESFSGDTKVRVVKTILPEKPNDRGEMIAVVMLEAETPSTFGGTFTTTSKMHLILDEETNEWKIDYIGDSIDESDFKNAPADAKAEDAGETL